MQCEALSKVPGTWKQLNEYLLLSVLLHRESNGCWRETPPSATLLTPKLCRALGELMGKYCAEGKGVVAAGKGFCRSQATSSPGSPPSPRSRQQSSWRRQWVRLHPARPARTRGRGSATGCPGPARDIKAWQRQERAGSSGSRRAERGPRPQEKSNRHTRGLERGQHHEQQMRRGRDWGRHLRSVAIERLSNPLQVPGVGCGEGGAALGRGCAQEPQIL